MFIKVHVLIISNNCWMCNRRVYSTCFVNMLLSYVNQCTSICVRQSMVPFRISPDILRSIWYFSRPDSVGSNNSTPELPKRPPLQPLTRSLNSAFEAYEKPLTTGNRGPENLGLPNFRKDNGSTRSSPNPKVIAVTCCSEVIVKVHCYHLLTLKSVRKVWR